MLQIKDDPLTQQKCYYVHYLDFEKRMDGWVDIKSIIKNNGINTKLKEFNGVKI